MKNKRIVSVILALAMVLSFLPNVQASAKVKLSTTRKTLYVGQSTTIKISGAKSVKWSVSNKCIKIVKKTNSYVKVKAVSVGETSLNAKVNGKTYICTFNVKELESKVIDKLLCEDENISIFFKEIKKGKIVLLVKNKSKKDFYYGNRYVVLNGKTYYDDFYVESVYSETDREFNLYIYDKDYEKVDYIFSEGAFSGRFYYYGDGSDDATDLKFDITI